MLGSGCDGIWKVSGQLPVLGSQFIAEDPALEFSRAGERRVKSVTSGGQFKRTGKRMVPRPMLV
jgi:hypothetical protein